MTCRDGKAIKSIINSVPSHTDKPEELAPQLHHVRSLCDTKDAPFCLSKEVPNTTLRYLEHKTTCN